MMCLPKTQALDGCGQNGYPVHTHPSLGLGQPRPHLLIPSGVTVGREEGSLPTGPACHPLPLWTCVRLCACQAFVPVGVCPAWYPLVGMLGWEHGPPALIGSWLWMAPGLSQA